MAPRKNAEKSLVKPLQVTARKGVRKRPITATIPRKRKQKILASDDSNLIQNHASLQNEPKKTRKTQRKKKSELNTDQDTTQNDVETPQLLTPKSKVKAIQKQKVSDIKVMIANEDTTQNDVETPQLLTPKSKVKAIQKQKVSDMKYMLANEDTTQNDAETPQLLTNQIKSPKSKVKAIQKQKVSDIKVMLANEVVRNAFQKKPENFINIDLSATPPCIETKTTKRGRTKKATLKLHDYVLGSIDEPTNNLENNKKIEDVTKKKAIKVVKKKSSTNASPAQEIMPELKTIPNNSPKEGEPKKRKRLSLRRKITPTTPQSLKRRKQAKEVNTEAILDATPTPSIVSECPKIDSTPEVNGHIKESEKPHRKSSITSSSTSCLSWTKDISSSSTTTCVTVQSNDFVRIDNKLPIIKLTNIHSKIKKQDNNANILFGENSVDSHSKNGISESTNISTGDLNVSQILNLSTSSLTSVTTNKTQNIVEPQTNNVGKNQVAVKKLQQSLDNLSSKMKHFDLEIINWIGYDEEITDPKTKEYHARILEVLKEENDIIKYCQQIKKVLTESDSQSFVDIENNSNKDITTPGPNATSNFMPPEAQTTNKDVHNDDVPSQEVVFTVNDSSQGKEDDLNQSDSRKENNPNCSSFVEPNVESRSIQKSFHTDHTEDDDAISLFAESLTGWETSKRNSTISKSIDTVDNEQVQTVDNEHGTSAKTKDSSRFERVRPPSDTEDELEKERVHVPNKITNITNTSEQNKANSISFFKRFADKSIFNNIQNITNRFSSSPSVSGLPNSRFHLPNNINKPANASELGNHFGESHNVANSVHQNLSSNFRFPDLKKFQIKVPVSLSDNCSRRCELVTDTDGDGHNSVLNFNKNTECQEVDVRMAGGGLENRINQINEANVNTEQVRIDNSGVQQITPQSLVVNAINKQPQYRGSIIFNCCIYNLVSKCRKVNCQFAHVSLTPETLSTKLTELSEQIFIKECMFLISKTMLMYNYGMCYVRECIRRNLTSVLLRITVNFITKVNKASLVVEVVEATLLHMNGIDFESCLTLLQCDVGEDTLLCDCFMKVISETQNFSRFKVVFAKLAAFMCRLGRPFALDVATQLLERVCILAYDDVLASALIEIMQNTDVQIFAAPMIASLEMKLCGYNSQLYEQLVGLKARAGLAASPQSPRLAPSAPHTSTPIANTASPDTSVVESGSNQTEPTITRTIFNNTASKNISLMAPGPDSSDDFVTNFELRNMPRWRNHPVYSIMRPQRKVFQQNWHAPRGYSGTPPRFRRPQPPPGC